MRSNLWYQINNFVHEIHIFGVYKHKNFLRSVNVNENKFMVPIKQFSVFLEKQLGANKQFLDEEEEEERNIKICL